MRNVCLTTKQTCVPSILFLLFPSLTWLDSFLWGHLERWGGRDREEREEEEKKVVGNPLVAVPLARLRQTGFLPISRNTVHKSNYFWKSVWRCLGIDVLCYYCHCLSPAGSPNQTLLPSKVGYSAWKWPRITLVSRSGRDRARTSISSEASAHSCSSFILSWRQRDGSSLGKKRERGGKKSPKAIKLESKLYDQAFCLIWLGIGFLSPHSILLAIGEFSFPPSLNFQ